MINPWFTCYKRTLPTHLEKFLTNFIREYYGEEILKQYAPAIKNLNNLRNEALCKCSEVSEISLNLVSEYYLALKALEPILNFQNTSSFVYTTWFDIFITDNSSRREITDDRFSFEIANVLNFLAFLLYELHIKGRETGNEININEVKNFQLVVGCLEEIKHYSKMDDLSSIMFGLSVECSNVRINRLLCATQLLLIPKLPDQANYCDLLGLYMLIVEKSRESLGIIENSDKSLLKTLFKRNIQKTERFALVSMLEIQTYTCASGGNCQSCVANIKIALDYAHELYISFNDNDSKNIYNRLKDQYIKAKQHNDTISKETDYCFRGLRDVKAIQIVEPILPNIENLLNSKSSCLIDMLKRLSHENKKIAAYQIA